MSGVYNALRRYFPNASFKLCLEPDYDGGPQAWWVYIQTNLSVEDAMARLEAFDHYWFEHCSHPNLHFNLRWSE